MSRFFDKKEVLLKSEKFYSSGKIFLAFINNENIFPFIIKLRRVKQDDVLQNYLIISKESFELKNPKYKLVYKDYNFKAIGMQTLPIEVVFENRDIFLEFISKQDEFLAFTKYYKKIIDIYPSLKELFKMKPKIITEHLHLWDKLLRICDFFLKNKYPNRYIRELSIEGVDTKFIERNKKIIDTLLTNLLDDDFYRKEIVGFSDYGFEKRYFLKYPLASVRFRILDDELKILNLSDISITVEEFKKLNFACKKVYIVENQITTLSFPKIKDAIVIFGSGYGVKILKDIEWLRDKELYYWGDIDIDGFAILSQARGYFKTIKSIFMDEKTINNFSNFAVKQDANKKAITLLENLTIDEKKIYEKLQNDFYGQRYRLEQERIPFDYVKNILLLQV